MKKNIFKSVSDDEKINIIEDFCKHLEEGRCEYSFVEYDFRDIEVFASELDKKNKDSGMLEKIRKSLRKSFAFWEKMLVDIYSNPEKRYFMPLWIFYVKSRFGFGISKFKSRENEDEIIDINLTLDKDTKKLKG
jgi:hypothetical protein